MTQVVSFEGYTPAARYDAIPWTKAKIEEAAASTGTWAQIDLLNLSPVDSDPSDPAVRNLTTALASDDPDLWYRITFVDGSGSESLPSDPVQNADTDSSRLYISRDALKVASNLTGQTYADADIDRACAAASRAIDTACRGLRGHFYQATETRYYTPDSFNCLYSLGEWRLEIDDLVSATAVTVDTAGDGSYSTTWVEGTDFYFDPANATTDGRPFEELTLRARGGRYFPNVQRAVKIEGTFGWPSLPSAVTQYATIFATQQVIRTRQAPFGIQIAGFEFGTAARISRTDPDFDRLLGELCRQKLWI